MRTAVELFRRLVRKTYRDTRLPVIAFAFGSAEIAPEQIAYQVEGANAEQMDAAAISLLSLILQVAADNETTCPCCLDRVERARLALSAMRGEAAARPGSVH